MILGTKERPRGSLALAMVSPDALGVCRVLALDDLTQVGKRTRSTTALQRQLQSARPDLAPLLVGGYRSGCCLIARR